MYSLPDKTVTLLRPVDEDLGFGRAGFGPGANQVATVISGRKANSPRETQIVVLNLLTDTYRKITSDASIKSSPNFSSDGRKVAYIQSHRDRTWFNGDPRATSWDVHTLDLTTGVSERITSYCFWGLGTPFFYPGSDDLVFDADGAMCNYPNVGEPAGSKDYLKYKEQFAENNIVRLGPNRVRLEPWFLNGNNSGNPSVARNGDVLFMSRTNEIDGIQMGDYNYDLFLRRGDDIRRLTNLGTFIGGSALSQDGKFVAYLSDPERRNRYSLWLIDIERDTHERIPLSELERGNEAQILVRTLTEESTN